jgi:hypothetical protein|nr:MAG TPA: hypothetical protein [Caudoviricetes sp.]
MNEKIADKVEELSRALEWTDEANALGEVECDYSADDTRGWLTMGPVRVEWIRDAYGDGLEDWVAVNVSVDGMPFDTDGYSDLDDAVKDATRTTVEWQRWCSEDIKDDVVAWLESRDECFEGDTKEDGSWMILWGATSVRGEFVGDGAFQWSVSNSETADYLDGDASDDGDAVIDAMVECSRDPMVEAWVAAVAVATAEDDWSVRSSEDQMTVWTRSSITFNLSRRAYYESVGYGEGRIELEHRIGAGEWTSYDEMLPEDEEDVRRMAGEAYAWVRSIDD